MEVIIGKIITASTTATVATVRGGVAVRALEQSNLPPVVGNPVPERVDGRHQNQAAPQTVDNGRDGSQQIDHIAQRGGELLRRIMRNEQRNADGHEEGNQQCQQRHEHSTEQQREHVAPEAAGLAAGKAGHGLAVGGLIATDEWPGAEEQEQEHSGKYNQDQDAAGVCHTAKHLVGGLATNWLHSRFVLRTHGFSLYRVVIKYSSGAVFVCDVAKPFGS